MSDNRVDSFWMSQSLIARLWSGLTAWGTCPTQLHLAPLADLEVLEDRKIVVEDRRHAHCISRHIANVTQARRIGETTDIDHVLHSCRVVSAHPFHWIASYFRNRVNRAASEI